LVRKIASPIGPIYSSRTSLQRISQTATIE
jgi:hypothetical protein